MILPSLELKDDEIDVDCYKCEYMVSSDKSLHETYRVRYENIEEFIKSKEKKLMIKDILTQDDKRKKKSN